jgi:hypothetical protein
MEEEISNIKQILNEIIEKNKKLEKRVEGLEMENILTLKKLESQNVIIEILIKEKNILKEEVMKNKQKEEVKNKTEYMLDTNQTIDDLNEEIQNIEKKMNSNNVNQFKKLILEEDIEESSLDSPTKIDFQDEEYKEENLLDSPTKESLKIKMRKKTMVNVINLSTKQKEEVLIYNLIESLLNNIQTNENKEILKENENYLKDVERMIKIMRSIILDEKTVNQFIYENKNEIEFTKDYKKSLKYLIVLKEKIVNNEVIFPDNSIFIFNQLKKKLENLCLLN